ncbi:MAG: DUF3288 family protein [Oscillatoria sp. Prado101]|jgi:hypothetical protein|nr:DUF3288 family protein [Oscillatoria sp. Prado101]
MAPLSENQEQQHPQAHIDGAIVENLLKQDPSDYNLAELARLLIRYRGFPGARDIQDNLQKTLQRWSLTEEDLYAKTREIHAAGGVYKNRNQTGEEED